MADTLSIGQVAKEVGVNPKLIRYYEEVGLIPPLGRSDAAYASPGYRRFTREDVQRLQFIKRARLLELPLADIRELLAVHETGCCGESRPSLLALLAAKRRDLDEKIAELQCLRADLERLYQDLTARPVQPQEEAACRATASACECLFGLVPTTAIAKPPRGEAMKAKTTVVKPEASSTQEPSADECCVPVCGPDTCGGVSTPVSVKPLVKAWHWSRPGSTDSAPREEAAAGGCCEPVCGPDTCGE